MENRLLCEDCSWTGEREECERIFYGSPNGDVTPVPHCPKCKSENLIPLIDELVPVG